ncbi:2',5'-phosphodiesterase 12 [Arapaima gigas]
MFGRFLRPVASFSLRLLRRLHGGMERAVVRCVPLEARMTVSLELSGARRHLQREQIEPLGKLLTRIAHNAVKGADKGKKSAATPAQGCEPTVSLYYNGEPVAQDTPNVDAWQDGAVLHVGERKYLVERNPPAVTVAELPSSPLAGFPVCPKLQVEFSDVQDCLFRWYKEGTAGGWTEVSNQWVFTPSNADVGLRLKLSCTPVRGAKCGEPWELVTTGTVEAGPGACTFDQRHLYTRMVAKEHVLRVVSYNILADVYAQTELARTVLYPYCAPYALQLPYRQSLLRKELCGYNADVVCLQEVDKAVFSDSLCPAFDAFGLQGVFRVKERQREGLATFFRTSKLELIARYDVTLSEALTSEPRHAELLRKLSTNEALKEKVVQRSTALQVTVFQSVKEPLKKLCVANTHLYWHPKGSHVRLIQMAVALQHLHWVTSDVHPGTPLLLAGDLNSSPLSGVLQLLTGGHIPTDHSDWASEGPDELCPQEVSSPFRLASACGEPAYTNYVGGFHGCLDYVLVEPCALQVEQVIPMPSHEEITAHQALPSVSHPSDHIALVCDLLWQ